eukprot:m.26674 g.26674  ORF g.26674 m.26674 type:complete len:139 (+) comp4335_c0_seq2:120-536(+)
MLTVLPTICTHLSIHGVHCVQDGELEEDMEEWFADAMQDGDAGEAEDWGDDGSDDDEEDGDDTATDDDDHDDDARGAVGGKGGKGSGKPTDDPARASKKRKKNAGDRLGGLRSRLRPRVEVEYEMEPEAGAAAAEKDW